MALSSNNQLSIVFTIARLLSAVLILVALSKMPYGYYSFMRLVVCGTFIIGAITALKVENIYWVVICIVLALLYNPVFPFHLGRDVWEPINIGTVVV